MKIIEETPDKIVIESDPNKYGYIGVLTVMAGIFFIVYINPLGLFIILLGICFIFLSPETTKIIDKKSQKIIIIEKSKIGRSKRKEIPFSELGYILIEELDIRGYGPVYCPDTWKVRIINDNHPIFQKIGEIMDIETRPDIFIYEFYDKQKSILFAERVSKITGKEVVCNF